MAITEEVQGNTFKIQVQFTILIANTIKIQKRGMQTPNAIDLLYKPYIYVCEKRVKINSYIYSQVKDATKMYHPVVIEAQYVWQFIEFSKISISTTSKKNECFQLGAKSSLSTKNWLNRSNECLMPWLGKYLHEKNKS